VDEAERGAIRRKQRKPRVEHEVIRERCERKVRGQQLGEEPRFGATRKAVNRRTVGDPRFRTTCNFVDCRSGGEIYGATRGLVSRHRRMMRTSGRLDDLSPVKPEMQDKGRPESYITGGAGEGESLRGNSEPY